MVKGSLPKQSSGSTSSPLYEATKRRLEAYGLFSDNVITRVAEVAQQQASYDTYSSYFAALGIPEPTLYKASKRRGVPVLDIPARQEATKGTIVVHLPMSNPLDQNQVYHIATLAATLPAYRIIGFGNPSGRPYNYRQQGRGPVKLFGIAFTRHRHSLVSPEIDYLRAQGVTSAHHVGYSYGAHKALIEAGYLSDDEVASITLIDPVAHPRGVKQLVHDFKSTFAPMGKYVDRTEVEPYFQARRAAAETQHHQGALRRPISVAIGVLMARFDLMTSVRNLIARNPHLYVTVAWGSRSELGNDAHMKTSVHQLAHDYPEHIKALRLKDDAHALGNDIHLYAAIVCTGVNR